MLVSVALHNYHLMWFCILYSYMIATLTHVSPCEICRLLMQVARNIKVLPSFLFLENAGVCHPSSHALNMFAEIQAMNLIFWDMLRTGGPIYDSVLSISSQKPVFFNIIFLDTKCFLVSEL